jgi:hypothetical protein
MRIFCSKSVMQITASANDETGNGSSQAHVIRRQKSIY